MGTRGSVGFILNGQYKASYNHFDSYPTGLGQDMADFVNKVNAEDGWGKFKKEAKKVKLVISAKKPTKAQIEKYIGFSNIGVGSGSVEDWYCLLRETQGAVSLEKIYEGTLSHMIDSVNFIKDSLFCEWAYIINLDEMTFDIYQGFQKSPDPKNIFGQTNEDGYYPCKRIVSIPLDRVINESYMGKLEKLARDIYRSLEVNKDVNGTMLHIKNLTNSLEVITKK